MVGQPVTIMVRGCVLGVTKLKKIGDGNIVATQNSCASAHRPSITTRSGCRPCCLAKTCLSGPHQIRSTNRILRIPSEQRTLDAIYALQQRAVSAPRLVLETEGVVLGTKKRRAFRKATSEGSPERSEEHTSELQSRFDLVCR